ncbi:hypothetical protein CWI39_0872p0010 [Hamiltosporidium magnivora]|uniref:Uncharacterized protein n=1 Tax=Hamiltosporidium magnivora TaxID=148818 RepID=A0A4Q9L8R2_9MICR|nr:hypothetical protein CWI39_0872p0010 [Hamiltosporidium magnivora]
MKKENSTEKSSQKETDYKKGDYKETDSKKGDYKEGDYKESDYKESDYKDPLKYIKDATNTVDKYPEGYYGQYGENTNYGALEDFLCNMCQGNGSINVLSSDTDQELGKKFTTFECKVCCIEDANNKNLPGKDFKGLLYITCHFDNKKDLERCILLKEKSRVYFTMNNVSYKYEPDSDMVTTVEKLIRQASDKISFKYNLYYPKYKDPKESYPHIDEKTSSGDQLYSDMKYDSKSGQDKETEQDMYKDSNAYVDFFDKILKDGCLKLTIKDKTGLSRVCPPHKKILDSKYYDIDSYNEEKIYHNLYMQC